MHTPASPSPPPPDFWRETPLARLLAERIHARGPIPFAEYMRECLYHPAHGYYSRAESQRFTDFYTSVDVHPVFGRLLARQFEEMWQILGRPAPFVLVEAGAGVARLASHILDFTARALPDFYAALHYVAVEQSLARRAAHSSALATHIAAGRASFSAELPPQIPVGCIFSNELLDALPTHRVLFASGALHELFVAYNGARFHDQPGQLSTTRLVDYFSKQGISLHDGQLAEVSLAACDWIEDAARRLNRGFVLTIDYGHPAAELYNERHMRGTLLAYRNHRATENFYAAPGEQDLTAHVNFSALELHGARAGLTTSGLVSQTRFLLALGSPNDFADLYDSGASETDRLRARLRLKTLIHPEGMGETFHVLLQHKALPSPPLLSGLSPL